MLNATKPNNLGKTKINQFSFVKIIHISLCQNVAKPSRKHLCNLTPFYNRTINEQINDPKPKNSQLLKDKK